MIYDHHRGALQDSKLGTDKKPEHKTTCPAAKMQKVLMNKSVFHA